MTYIYNYQDFIAEGNKKVTSANCIRRSLASNKPSCKNDAAKMTLQKYK